MFVGGGGEGKSVSCSVLPNSLQPHGLQPTSLIHSWNSLGKNIGVGCHSFLQEILPTQGLKPGLLHCRQILYLLSHQGSPGGWGWCYLLIFSLLEIKTNLKLFLKKEIYLPKYKTFTQKSSTVSQFC